MRSHIPNMEKLWSQTSSETTKLQIEPLWLSKNNIEYEYGQLNLSEEKSRQFNLQ